MSYHLVCVQPFHGYDKGQIVTDEAEVLKLMEERDPHFVRIPAPEPAPVATPTTAPKD